MMRSTRLCLQLLAACACSLAAAGATGVGAPEAAAPGFVSVPMTRSVRRTIRGAKPLSRRFATVTDVDLENISEASYLIALTIGGQSVSLAIDTGSDQTWTNPGCLSVLHLSQITECLRNGKYSPYQSGSARILNIGTKIPYGVGQVELQFVQDTVAVQGTQIELQAMQFGVALHDKKLNEGIVGLGFGIGHGPDRRNANLPYPNFIDQLVMQNATRSRAFSVALGGFGGAATATTSTSTTSSMSSSGGGGSDSSTESGTPPATDGTILFGGVDTHLFTGDLVALPLLGPQNGETVNRYWVRLASIGTTTATAGSTTTESGTTSSSSSPPPPPSSESRRDAPPQQPPSPPPPTRPYTHTYAGSSAPVVLDTGSTLCSLPAPVVEEMARGLGGYVDPGDGYAKVPCAAAQAEGATFDFRFGGGGEQDREEPSVTIRVPYSDFILRQGLTTCILAAQPMTSSSSSSSPQPVTASAAAGQQQQQPVQAMPPQPIILGDSFLRSAYVVFDQDKMQISMAQYASCGGGGGGGGMRAIEPDAGAGGIRGNCTQADVRPLTAAAPPSTQSGSPAGAQGQNGGSSSCTAVSIWGAVKCLFS